MSCVTCHKSRVRCHIYHVTCHVPHVKCFLFVYKLVDLFGNVCPPYSTKTLYIYIIFVPSRPLGNFSHPRLPYGYLHHTGILLVTSDNNSTSLPLTCLIIGYQQLLQSHKKLDGVGPVDNRPSTNKLHHFVQKKEEEKVTCHMWHMTCDTWHVTSDMWHVTCDTWNVTCLGGGEHSLKMSAPWLLLFVIYDNMKIWRKRITDWIN